MYPRLLESRGHPIAQSSTYDSPIARRRRGGAKSANTCAARAPRTTTTTRLNHDTVALKATAGIDDTGPIRATLASRRAERRIPAGLGGNTRGPALGGREAEQINADLASKTIKVRGARLAVGHAGGIAYSGGTALSALADLTCGASVAASPAVGSVSAEIYAGGGGVAAAKVGCGRGAGASGGCGLGGHGGGCGRDGGDDVWDLYDGESVNWEIIHVEACKERTPTVTVVIWVAGASVVTVAVMVLVGVVRDRHLPRRAINDVC
jgi:hypothetical protein